jgi:hypothetical protein
MPHFAIIAPPGPRITYVLDWIFKERLQSSYELLHPNDARIGFDMVISYGTPVENTLFIPSVGLLQSTGIYQHALQEGVWENIPILYAAEGDIPFDLFSAVFFLITRYEEYYSKEQDAHERYLPSESILFKMDCLQRPLVDEWLWAFNKYLEKKFSCSIQTKPYSCLPSYDIDLVYKYKRKTVFVLIVKLIQSIYKANFRESKQLIRFLLFIETDPYDSFPFIKKLHQKIQLKPLYFLLCALEKTAYDRNVHPHKKWMKKLMRILLEIGNVGLHPSYYSYNNKVLLNNEKGALENVLEKEIPLSRQHYIRLCLPQTYRILESLSITDDFSMGYASELGFRAGTGRSFLWYDLEKETCSELRVHPFCFMDATAHYYKNLTAEEAFTRLETMNAILKKTNSKLMLVMHNYALGNDQEWEAWQKTYEHFLLSQYPTF